MSDEYLLDRIRRLEEQVRVLSFKLGVDYDDGTSGVPDDVVQLVRDGKLIHAIKRYRDVTGTDLETAKRVVEGIR
jgi:hypothetical protein